MADNIKYMWCSPNADSNKEFLGFIYERLYRVFGDKPYSTHMQRLEKLINQADGTIPNKLEKILEHNPKLKAQREAFRKAINELDFDTDSDINLAIEAFDRVNNLKD